MGSNPELVEDNEAASSKALWVFLALFLFVLAALWTIQEWQKEILSKKQFTTPFLQVTNRDFSLFLWQNPEFMCYNGKRRFGRCSYSNAEVNIQLIPEFADEYVAVPPEVIFRYHTWKRLLGDTLAPRSIHPGEFHIFLLKNPEWTPRYWKKAPQAYRAFLKTLSELQMDDLQTLPFATLPKEVRLAFQGWRNVTKEWINIESIHPTGQEMQQFLELHPTYNRNYWRNILMKSKPGYLKNFPFGPDPRMINKNEVLTADEFSHFLKVGFYNYANSEKGRHNQSF